jgi:hypothetical protein
MSRVHSVIVLGVAALVASCGGGAKPGESPTQAGVPKHKCGEHETVQHYDLHDEDGQDHFVPCAETGHEDFSGLVHIDTVAEGIRITIRATDDDFNEGKLGSSTKGRDAVIVFPKGPGTEGVEVPLQKADGGYMGERIIPFDALPKLTDEGTKIDVKILDHDDSHKDGTHEELKITVAISAGKSCEKARDENVQEMDMSKKGAPDLSDEQLGAPMKTSAFMSHCSLPDDANAKICVAVKKGKPVGVSVNVSPQNNKVASCIDRATRKLSFPKSDKLDVVTQSF